VNNHGGFGRWGFVEVTNPTLVKDILDAAIASLYADGPILGPHDVLDYDEVTRYASAR
jgi:type III restriction enzyme